MKESLQETFCRCIKKVRKTVKVRKPKSTKESAAIAICVKSVLQSKGSTLRKFNCKHKKLETQPLKNKTKR